MSVTNYTPLKDRGCKYNYSKLKDVVYLVSADHVKDVHIDNGYAYIDGLSELPLKINGFNIQFTENDSLDERYKFDKKLTLSMHGYVNVNYFDKRYYAIIETTDGTFYMINVDFPSRITYTFNLAANTNQTDFTFASLSNFPALKLSTSFESEELDCIGYNVSGIDSLQLVEKNYVTMVKDDNGVRVNFYGGKTWNDVEFLRNSCSLQEVFDGEKVTDTITFDIGFDNYKTSWHYNLLEFLENLYAARIIPKNHDNEYFIGFNFGLHPSYEIDSASSNNGTGKITVTLIDAAMGGLTAANDYSEEHEEDTKWIYVKWVNNIKGYECIGLGRARYLLQQEIDGLGNPTGNYKCLQGYEEHYIQKGLNIVGVFTTEQEFDSLECGKGDECELYTDMPSTLFFKAVTCNTYSLSATCVWSITDLPSYITVQPSNGLADQLYNVTVCNTLTPTSTMVEGTFNIHYGDKTKVENVKVQIDKGFITPEHIYIDCLPQNVQFEFNPDCRINVISIDSSLSYTIGNGVLIVSVPKNDSSVGGITFPIIVEDCNGERATVYIHQDHVYEKWVLTEEYICQNGNSYEKLVKYTGTTPSTINVRTSETKAGEVIKYNDPRCVPTQTKWEFVGNYTCVDGNKYKVIEEFISYDAGQTWTKTGQTKLGSMVESASTWCEESVVYSWVLTDKFQCDEDEDVVETRWVVIEGEYACSGFDKMTKEKKQESVNGGPWTDVYEDGQLVTRVGTTVIEHNSHDCGYSDYKFKALNSQGDVYSAECSSSSVLTTGDTHIHTPLSDIVSAEIGTCVTEIGNHSMSDFEYLTAITIPTTVSKIGEFGFEQDQKLKTINLVYITSIGNHAFFNCWDLNNIILNNNCVLGSNCFENCKSLTSINIPTTFNYNKIGDRTFRNCSNLENITIPGNVSSIGSMAFYGCTKLQYIICKSSSPASLGETVFTNTNECPIFVPDNSVDMYKGRWSAYRERIKPMSEYEQWMEYLESLTAEFTAATSLVFDGTANDKMVGTFEILKSELVPTPIGDLTREYITDFSCELIDGDDISYSTSMREYNTSTRTVAGGDVHRLGTLALYMYANTERQKTATFSIYANFYTDESKSVCFFKKNVGTIEVTQRSI